MSNKLIKDTKSSSIIENKPSEIEFELDKIKLKAELKGQLSKMEDEIKFLKQLTNCDIPNLIIIFIGDRIKQLNQEIKSIKNAK